LTSEDQAISIDWDALFSTRSIVLVGDPLSGIFSLFNHIKKKNPASEVLVVQDRNSVVLFENADVIIEVVQKIAGAVVERDLIIQKWKGHALPTILIPFLIKADKIELDTKARVV
jgi:hypothetical protein